MGEDGFCLSKCVGKKKYNEDLKKCVCLDGLG